MTPTFESAGGAWAASLSVAVRRNCRPLSANTQRIYKGNLARLTKHFGRNSLPSITNKLLRDYVTWMRSEKYSASQITSDLIVTKLVCESVTDDDGNPRYPLKINHRFVATPIVNPDEQEAPVATRKDVERALAVREIAGVVAIAAGAGLRISEVLSLRLGDDGENDSWDAEGAAIHIRKTLKTPSAARTVYLGEELNTWLRDHTADAATSCVIFETPLAELYRILNRAELPPWHSYRRFYATHRDELMMNEQVLKVLMGHSRGAQKNVTNRYKRARVEFIKTEVERCGLGFTLPVATRELVPA
jgi:integrase